MAATLLRLCRKGTNRESLIMLMLLSAVDGASIVGVFSSLTLPKVLLRLARFRRSVAGLVTSSPPVTPLSHSVWRRRMKRYRRRQRKKMNLDRPVRPRRFRRRRLPFHLVR